MGNYRARQQWHDKRCPECIWMIILPFFPNFIYLLWWIALWCWVVVPHWPSSSACTRKGGEWLSSNRYRGEYLHGWQYGFWTMHPHDRSTSFSMLSTSMTVSALLSCSLSNLTANRSCDRSTPLHFVLEYILKYNVLSVVSINLCISSYLWYLSHHKIWR